MASIFTLALITLVGCESTDSSSNGQTSAPMGKQSGRVAILPAKDMSYLMGESAFIYPMVDAQLRSWLEQAAIPVASAGNVQALLAANGHSLLREIQSAKPQEMSQAITDLIWKLRDSDDIDVLVIPQVMVRSVMLDRPYAEASWDGVTRPFIIYGDAGSGEQLQVETASLAIGVYNRFGQAIYFGRGGIDFMENATRAGAGLYTSPRLAGQIDATAIDEAIRLALQPWLSEFHSSVRVAKNSEKR
ncbi:hypothetical protein [Cerasicoccus arenae]|nr:hypothetical protein [Cerasicoccus arenae]